VENKYISGSLFNKNVENSADLLNENVDRIPRREMKKSSIVNLIDKK